MEITTKTPEETQKVAADFAKKLNDGDIVALHGSLGAGKTVFTKGIVAGLGIKARVTSPTFIFLKTYRGNSRIVNHIDLYRGKRLRDFGNLGLDELFDNHTITVIEWPERLSGRLPKERIDVYLESKNEITRTIVIKYPKNHTGS